MRIWRSWSVRGICLTLLCLFFTLYPLFAGPGPVNTRGGGDSPFLFVRLEQLVDGLRSGAFPVRWMPDAAHGLGYPFFNFYAALPYYVAAVFRFLGWGTIRSLQATQVLGLVLAALAMALLARHVLHHPAAVALAAVAYTCAPFHLVNVYVRGDSLSEFYAFVFYPLVFLALLRLYDDPSPPGVAWLALSYGGLILTHNLSALIFSPFVAAFAVLLLWPESDGGERKRAIDRRAAWLMIGGGVLGLALSACLWLAAAVDLDDVWMGFKDIQTSGFFNYAAQFRGRDLVQPALLFDYELSGHTPFAMGAVQTASILLGMVLLAIGWIQRKSQSPLAAFWIIGFALSTLMITPASQFLWDHVPVLPIVQFPWRFLSVQAFFGALIVGGLADRLPRPWLVATVGAVLLTFASVGNLHPEYLTIDESDVTPERLALFESFTTNIGTTIRGEYLPAAVEPRPWASAATFQRGRRPLPIALTGAIAQATLIERDARSERWQVMVTSEEAQLAFYTFYFAGWRAQLDGERVVIEPLSNSGLISIRALRGEHTIVLRFGRTPVRWIADGTSLAAILVVIALLWPLIRMIGGVPWRYISTAIAGILTFLGVLVLVGGMLSVSTTTLSDDSLSMDFDRMPFLHHNPKGIDFGGRARLDTYAFQGTAHGDGALTVTLRWAQQDSDLTAALWLVAPSDTHPDLRPAPPPLARASSHIEGATTRHVLFVPADAASGPYYLSLRVFDGQEEVRAVNAWGDTLGTTYLRPVWVDNPRPARESDPILARFGDRISLRDDVQVETDGINWDVKLSWQATAPIAINYTCSLRMLDANGQPLPNSQRDFEGGPGHGFWPTSAWPVGQWLTDRLRLPVPSAVRAEDAAALSVVLYDRSQPGFPAAGSVIVPLVEREHRYDAPPMARRIEAMLGDQVKLLGYDLIQNAASLRLTLHWQAVQRMSADYSVFVHLFDPGTEEIVVQSDAKPLRGTYPTNWWRTGEVVSDEVVLLLTDVPSGSYRLAVGMYDADDNRLPVVVASKVVSDGRLILEETISVAGEK